MLCELGGRRLDPENAAQLAGRSGLLRCTTADTGQLHSERTLRKGQFSGRQRTFWGNGRVKLEEHTVNAKPQGLRKLYFANGQIEDLQYFQAGREVFAMAYYPEGYLYELRCPSASVTPQDRRPCGFDGPQETTLLRSNGQRGALQIWARGRLVASSSYRDDGSLGEQFSWDAGRRVQRIYHSQGASPQLREERIYAPDKLGLTQAGGTLLVRRVWDASGRLVLEEGAGLGK